MSNGRRDRRLTLEQSKRLSRARVLGPGTALPILLRDDELARLLSVILSDTGNTALDPSLPGLPTEAQSDYYSIPLAWFEDPLLTSDFTGSYLLAASAIRDFDTYFDCLCELHKRRRKYERILSAQPLPETVQVSPRALLEFGVAATPALSSWLT